MVKLEYLLKILSKSRGIYHIGARQNVKKYIDSLSLEEFKKEVEQITDLNLLRYLWEVGLNAEQQQIVLKRLQT